MNPEIKAKWVEALRSGEYAQTVRRLARIRGGTTQYCCLGVLCEVNAEPRRQTRMEDDSYTYGANSTGSLEYGLQEKYGLAASDHSHLIGLNDGGASFLEIADYIEANL